MTLNMKTKKTVIIMLSFLFTGVTQQSTDSESSLIIASQSVGNFKTMQLQKQVGQWEIRMVSTNPYTLKVKGDTLHFYFCAAT